MELALVRLLGSGISVVTTAFGFKIPDDAASNGYATIDYLSRHDGVLVKQLVDSVVGKMWQSLRHAKMPRAAALATLEGLPAIIDVHSPPSSYFVSALVNTSVAKRKLDADVNAPGRAIAAETIMRARETNALEKAGLNEQLCFFFLERLYSGLLAERSFFETLKPALEAYLSHQHWQDGVEQPTPAPGLNADVAAPIPSALPPTLDKPAVGSNLSEDFDTLLATAKLSILQEKVAQYRERLTSAEQNGDPGVLTHLRLRLGRLLAAIGEDDRDIAVLEQAVTQLRLGLETELELAPDVPASTKSQLALGHALWQLGELSDDSDRAIQAIDQLDHLCEVLHESCNGDIWVDAHCSLAVMLIAQADAFEATGASRSSGPAMKALQRAGLAFQLALQRISRNDKPIQWATLTNQHASLIWHIGDQADDFETVSLAAEMKMAALETFEAQGDDVAAEQVRDEQISVQEVMQRIQAGTSMDLNFDLTQSRSA